MLRMPGSTAHIKNVVLVFFAILLNALVKYFLWSVASEKHHSSVAQLPQTPSLAFLT